MHIQKQVLPWLSVTAISVLITGCGPSLKSQCQKLGQAHNTTFNKSMSLKKPGSLVYDHEQEKQKAKLWTESSEKIAKLKLSDSKLKKIQAELVAAHQQVGEKTREAADLIPPHNQVNDALGDQIDQVRNGAMSKIPTAVQALTLHCTAR
ncbi:hypothetical protein [Acaryochloris sp. IP29b_bin.148]|uniref:hypothetical protein n=1 Tax=Acaryochloris sp. IP29b_bin.148 TaxID=2969218 RepID=UPI002626F24A|nr:hypothetical protein [Acaryochloris sp. IP29b_bin.148]